MSNKQSVVNSQIRKKAFAVDMMGGKCQICGYDKCINALEFHHINDDKEYDPAYIVRRWSWERVKPELEKCIMVCANCHRELHHLDIDIDYKYLVLKFEDKTCDHCNKGFSTRKSNAKYCSTLCKSLSDRKVDRPTKDELYDMLKSGESWVDLGRKFKVSDNAIKKWAKSYGLPHTTKQLKSEF